MDLLFSLSAISSNRLSITKCYSQPHTSYAVSRVPKSLCDTSARGESLEISQLQEIPKETHWVSMAGSDPSTEERRKKTQTPGSLSNCIISQCWDMSCPSNTVCTWESFWTKFCYSGIGHRSTFEGLTRNLNKIYNLVIYNPKGKYTEMFCSLTGAVAATSDICSCADWGQIIQGV